MGFHWLFCHWPFRTSLSRNQANKPLSIHKCPPPPPPPPTTQRNLLQPSNVPSCSYSTPFPYSYPEPPSQKTKQVPRQPPSTSFYNALPPNTSSIHPPRPPSTTSAVFFMRYVLSSVPPFQPSSNVLVPPEWLSHFLQRTRPSVAK